MSAFGIHTTGENLSDQLVVHDGIVDLPVAEVWRRWTTEQGIRDWFAPDCKVELRVGGPFEMYFLTENPSGSRGGEGNVFLGFVPERWLSFTWNAPPHLKTRSQHTWVVLELEPMGEGTFVRLTHTGWPKDGMADPESDWPATFAYFQDAWGRVIAALIASAAD